ncbi:MAG TPA: hypothetical protein VEX15_23525 [Nocardioidaceae bacterium]|nr:hypothetical protein [Nocardioidaceae bacterium]
MPKNHLTRAAVLLGTGAALALGSTVVATTPASADTPGCVTKNEFRKVHKGMSRERVQRIFDNKGHQTYTYWISGDHYSGRDYRACRHPQWSLVSIDYLNGKVDSKFAYWG